MKTKSTKLKKGTIVKILDPLWATDAGIAVVLRYIRINFEFRNIPEYIVIDISNEEIYYFDKRDLKVLGTVTELEKLIWNIK